MLTLTSQYALRALIHLCQHEEEWPIPGSRIAAETESPPNYLSKVLGDLVKGGLLESSPGKAGGFRLSVTAKQASLLEGLSPFEPFGRRSCPFGNRECGDENPCNAHENWKQVVEAQQVFLRMTTVQDIAVGIPKETRDRSVPEEENDEAS